MENIIPAVVVLLCSGATFAAMQAQRLLNGSLVLAPLFAIASNYTAPALSDSGIAEIVARAIVAYLILRGCAEMLKRNTAGGPVIYAAQQPVIEFEEVNS